MANDVNTLDTSPTAYLRVRGWAHQGGSLPQWPIGAHASVELAWAETGALTYEIGSEVIHVPSGAAMIVPAGVEHRTRISPGLVAGSIWLGRDLVSEVAEAVRSKSSLRLIAGVARDPARLITLGRWLTEEVRRPSAEQLMAMETLTEALALEILRSGNREERSRTARDPRICAAIDQIETCFAQPLAIDSLARTARLSRFHFTRLFRAQTRSSPYQYLIATRVSRAATLLRAGHGVTESALQVGFSDLGRFSRMFRKQLGRSPSEYRAEARSAVRSARSA